MVADAVGAPMFRAILPEGELDCERFEHVDHGVELYTEDDEMMAFVPYYSLVAIIDDEAYQRDDRSLM